jgi:hypothetical protein
VRNAPNAIQIVFFQACNIPRNFVLFKCPALSPGITRFDRLKNKKYEIPDSFHHHVTCFIGAHLL